MKELKIGSIILIAVAVICFVVAGILYYRTKSFIDRAERVQGAVVDYEVSSGSSSTMYYPVVEFVTKDGREIVWHSNTGSNSTGFKIGEKVRVLYDRDDPEEAKIVTFWQLWLGTFIAAALGFLFGLLGAAFTFAASRFRGE